MGKKSRGNDNQKFLSGRKKHKLTDRYIKSANVAPEESAGSDYRKKLKERRWGRPSGEVRPNFEFIEAARPQIPTRQDKKPPRISSEPKRHKPYTFEMLGKDNLLITDSFIGPASRNIKICYGDIPAIENKNLRFKPTFLVAEKVTTENESHWKISRYVGISQPDGKFNGEITEIGKFEDLFDEEVILELADWSKKAGRDVSSLQNHMFPEAVKITANTDPYGYNYGFRRSGGLGGFGYR